MFKPITSNMEERLELIKNSMSKDIATEELAKCESLEDFYWFSERVRNGVFAQMQLYVLNNFEKLPLERWNEHNFTVVPHTGNKRMFFGKKDKFIPKKNEILSKLFEKRHNDSTKITSIKFVLDEHDGDFSVTFNETVWTFVWANEILEYYMVIKNYLEDENS